MLHINVNVQRRTHVYTFISSEDISWRKWCHSWLDGVVTGAFVHASQFVCGFFFQTAVTDVDLMRVGRLCENMEVAVLAANKFASFRHSSEALQCLHVGQHAVPLASFPVLWWWRQAEGLPPHRRPTLYLGSTTSWGRRCHTPQT